MLILKLALIQMVDTLIDCSVQALVYGVPKDENDITEESVKRLTEYIKET